MIKGASAPPYSINAITYNHLNLPLTITTSGGTSTYRYDETGQRIAKQVNGGNVEVYVREGATVLGVFWISGSTVDSSYFNLLWENRVVGRHTSSGARRYYHFDHLGSTRAVASTTGQVTESYDFEPWGLLMPGRTLGSGTTEGFTSKERDSETGLDYFGARHYTPALGRWTTVDPLADSTPEWSPFVYVNDNPIGFTDPDGRQVEKCRGDPWAEAQRNEIHYSELLGCGPTCRERPLIDESWNTFSAVTTVPGASTVLRSGLRALGRNATRRTLAFGDDALRITSKYGDDATQAGTQGIEAFHHTFSDRLTSIKTHGLRQGTYATPTGTLSPIQAQIELALPPNRGLPDGVVRIDVAGLRKAGYKIPKITRVSSRFGLPGGGYEMRFPYPIPREFVTVVR